MLSKLFSMFRGWFGGREVSITEQILVEVAEELQPKEPFFFPETIGEWHHAVLEFCAQCTREDAEHDARLDEIQRETTLFVSAKEGVGGTEVQKEIECRRIDRLITENHRLYRDEYEKYYHHDRYEGGGIYIPTRWKKGRKSEEQVEKEFHEAEMQRIAHQGQIVCQTFKDGVTKESMLEGYCPARSFREERRVVLLKDGRPFLCHLTHWVVMKEVGQKRVTICSGYYGKNSYPKDVAVLEPTECCQPPVVDWVNCAVTQFRNEELEKVVSHG